MLVNQNALLAAKMAADQAFAHVPAARSKKSSPNGSPTSSRSLNTVVAPGKVGARAGAQHKGVRAKSHPLPADKNSSTSHAPRSKLEHSIFCFVRARTLTKTTVLTPFSFVVVYSLYKRSIRQQWLSLRKWFKLALRIR